MEFPPATPLQTFAVNSLDRKAGIGEPAERLNASRLLPRDSLHGRREAEALCAMRGNKSVDLTNTSFRLGEQE
jgi:hypothetical protein